MKWYVIAVMLESGMIDFEMTRSRDPDWACNRVSRNHLWNHGTMIVGSYRLRQDAEDKLNRLECMSQYNRHLILGGTCDDF